MSGFPFPRPTQLPDELESALAIRSARDRGQGTESIVGQHGVFSSSSRTLTSDNQSSLRPRADWSNFQPPNKLFASSSDATYHPQQIPGIHQQPQSKRTGASLPSWLSSSSTQTQQPHSGVGDGQGFYTPESAGSILASFGLSNEDLEVLSHYPDDQLTPDTLPFILRDIQINKSDNQDTMARNMRGGIRHPSNTSQPIDTRSSEVPSFLSVTKTAGKVIDYGHASRAKEGAAKETFKRERISNERVIQMYPSSASAPKMERAEKRHIRLVHMEPSKHGDRDYRRTSGDHYKRSFSPSKSRFIDKDYRQNGSKQRISSDTRSEIYSRRSLSASSGTSGHSSKKIPDSNLIMDFSGSTPKVYPHSCSLCHIQCDDKKAWVDHINTVNHTAACRDLRNKYRDWKPPREDLHRPHGRPYSPYDHHHHHYTGDSSHQSRLKRPYSDLNRRSVDTSSYASSYRSDQSSKYVKKTKLPDKTNKTASSKAADTSSSPSPAKKKKKTVAPVSQDSTIAERLVYLTGIPEQATEEQVIKLVGSYGKINNVILIPLSQEESEKGDGQKASVCMVNAADAQSLANATNLAIEEQPITALIAKTPETGPSPVCSNSKPSRSPEKSKEDSDLPTEVSEADKNAAPKAQVLIAGLPPTDCSESDVIELIQPFGTPTDMIFARAIGKALVSFPDLKTAQEVVKSFASVPAKINDCELKLMDIEHHTGTDKPVALYNLLMQSLDPQETSAPVSWNSLVVINNVPDSPRSSSEVKQLVQRFGTVVKCLELKNMVICEMATGAMALSVYKRFQNFPCVIQTNPLFFSRKPDPKANTCTLKKPPNLQSPEVIVNDEDNTGAAEQKETELKENISVESDNEPDTLVAPQEVVQADEVLGEDESISTHMPSDALSESALEAAAKTDEENISSIDSVMTSDKGASGKESIMETTVNADDLENKTHAGEDTSVPLAISEDITEDQAGTSTNHHAITVADSANNNQTSVETEEENVITEELDEQKVVEDTKGTEKNHTKTGVKTQDGEQREKEARKGNDRRVKERSTPEKWPWSKYDRDQDYRTKRERREKGRRKEHYDRSSGSRSSHRIETSKMVEQKISDKTDELPKMDEDEDFDSFLSSMGDFVTVDEVGDVTDMDDFPESNPPALEETTEQKASLTDVQQDIDEVIPMEVSEGVTAHRIISEDTITDVGHQPTTLAETSNGKLSDVIGTQSSDIAAPPIETEEEHFPVNQNLVPTCQLEKNETESTSDESTGLLEMTSGNAAEKKQNEATTEVDIILDNRETPMLEKAQDTRTSLLSDEPVVTCGIPTSTEDKNEINPTTTESPSVTDNPLNFDPDVPVGMEFLVPKTGFFCKVCNRFFSGNEDTQITHCKSFKHFENLQKYLNTTVKPKSSQ
ncbi:zinc finger protein 638-like isoform X2 [Corythoichthys intestinalis]|uniref:zinc finger protein 638-like isoform X2 n=1 Tax=Corythoichthys intestinalis TaxID=161448 RepID=UPI0025A666B4|nr:zinc finger protein 638-like isoform X2 [Corythoichthys intestinalis]